MSKSLRNEYTLDHLEARGVRPIDFRYHCLTLHYRTPMNFTWEAQAASARALARLKEAFASEGGAAGGGPRGGGCGGKGPARRATPSSTSRTARQRSSGEAFISSRSMSNGCPPPGEEPIVKVTTVDDLMEMAHGYQRSMVLLPAVDLGIFSALSEGPSDALRLARRVAADPPRPSLLLNALVGAGLLRKKGKTYRNGEIASRFLADGPLSKASILLHHLDCWPEWTTLSGKIRAGVKAPGKRKGYQENFIRGMEDNARERAISVAKRFPLREGERVLALGGGPGTDAVA